MPKGVDAVDLIGTIYETSAFPDRWPSALEKIANHVGALGGNLIRSTGEGVDIVSSPAIEDLTREFLRQGWHEHNTRISRRLERAGHPGFLTDSDLHTPHELATLPMYTEFLTPNGAEAGAGTVIQGACDDGLLIALEAFASHEASRAAVPQLDLLRPHLARAAVLGSQIQAAFSGNLVEAFEAVGSAIALLDRRGRAVAMSRRFAAETAELMSDSPVRLRMSDPEADRRFALALTQRHATGLSLALRNRGKVGAAVLHLIPARHDARELFTKVTMFAVLARTGNEALPASDIIAALFDLTPAEARVARAVAEGLAPAEVARNAGLSPETVRSQLKRVFAKTSTRRQSELASLIAKFAVA